MDHNEAEWLKQKIEFLELNLDTAKEALKQIAIPLVPERNFTIVARSALKAITPAPITGHDEHPLD